MSLIANISACIHRLPAGDRYPCLKTQRVWVSTFEKVTGTHYPFLLPVLCLRNNTGDTHGYWYPRKIREPSPVLNGYSGTATRHPRVIPRVSEVHRYPRVSSGTITKTLGTHGTRWSKFQSCTPVATILASLACLVCNIL